MHDARVTTMKNIDEIDRSIDLNQVIPTLLRGSAGRIELYEAGGKALRSMEDLRTDVCVTASALGALGVGRGSRVGIVGTTDYAWIRVDLACLALGAITVPIDPDAPWSPEEVARHHDVDLVLTNRPEHVGKDGFVSFENVCRGEPGPIDLMPARFGEDDPFTLVFTSGTSGTPKGIAVRKKCFDDQFVHALRMFDVTASDRMLVFLPMHIYLERCYVYLSILRGFTGVVVSPRLLVRALKTAEITFTVGVPHFFQSFRDLFLLEVKANEALANEVQQRLSDYRAGNATAAPFGPFQRFWGGRARFFLTGSARCEEDVLHFYHAMGVPLYEGYGMSEIAGMVALNYPGHTKIGTVGKVFPNKTIKIAEAGQILVRGDHVANTGYTGASEEVNRETFLADGWIATGDVGHFDDEGYLTIDGRLKDVVVLANGMKVQPGPLEARINAGEHIAGSVVLGDERPYLVALVALRSPSVDPRVVDSWLREVNQSLPEAQRIKKHRVIDDSFSPESGLLTPSFKLNRKHIKVKYAELLDEMYAP